MMSCVLIGVHNKYVNRHVCAISFRHLYMLLLVSKHYTSIWHSESVWNLISFFHYNVLDGMMTVILWWSDKPLQTVVKVAGFWALLTAYHSVALLLHSCTVHTEKGISIKVEKSQTYVKTQNQKVQSGTERNQDTKRKEWQETRIFFFF